MYRREILESIDEIEFKNLSVDGTKIEVNANKYTFVWRSAITKNEKKLQDKCREYLLELGYTNIPEHISSEYIGTILDDMNKTASVEGIEFVYGIGHRKTQIQKDIEKLIDFYNREKKYEISYTPFKGRNSYSKTDTDAAFKHLKEDHMRNGQLKAAYNVQVGVDSEYIVVVDIFQNRSDVNTLIPFMDRIKKQYGKQYENLVADAGYQDMRVKKITIT